MFILIGQRAAFSKKDRQKIARQDPSIPQKVSEIFKFLSKDETNDVLPTKPPTTTMKSTKSDGDEVKKAKKTKKRKSKPDAPSAGIIPTALLPSRAEALDKLQAKIEELRSKVDNYIHQHIRVVFRIQV